MQQRAIESLSRKIARLQHQSASLKVELHEVRGENPRRRRRNSELEMLLSKDSHNSSPPPLTDPPWRKRTRSLRRSSGKHPRGQAAHEGACG
jgi:transposase